ncbi:MAG: hypothetical protein PHG25_01590 [Candidatus Pacebacteria bacterium]|nr:hypothetical protein [Candidatus Paceibacterota bacterium]
MKIKKAIIWFVAVLAIGFILCSIYFVCVLSQSDSTDLSLNAKRFGTWEAVKGFCLGITNSGVYQAPQQGTPIDDELDHMRVLDYNSGVYDPLEYQCYYLGAHIWYMGTSKNYVNIGSVEVWFSRGLANRDLVPKGSSIASVGSSSSNNILDYRYLLVKWSDANNVCTQTNTLIATTPPLHVAEILTHVYVQQVRGGRDLSATYIISDREPVAPLALK